jgi:hypothetical protein
MYRIFAIFGDERLPREFEGPPSTAPHHLVLRELATTIDSLSQATQDVLRPFLVPPIYSESWFAQRLGLSALAAATTPHAELKTRPLDSIVPCKANEYPTIYKQVSTHNFNIHYLGGAFADANTDVGVALVASLVEDVYDADTGLLQRLPLTDVNEPCNGGDGKYDIYYIPGALVGLAAWTISYPTAAPNKCSTRPSYMMINSFSAEFFAAEQQPVNARLMIKSILAHEFLHALQFAMPRQASCKDTEWFDEATAQWLMDYVVPTIPQGLPGGGGMESGLNYVSNYLKSGTVLAEYLYSDHMKSIEKPGFEPKLNGYSDYLFFQFLARTQTPNKIKQIFDAMVGGKNSVEAITAVVDMKATWPEFAKTLWIGIDDHVLDYWAKEDEYQFGLSRVFAQVPTQVISELTDRLKSVKAVQKSKNHAEFDLLDNALTFGGDYEIDPRSIFYEHLKFTDPTVHYVEFYNPIADDPGNGSMKVQVLKKIAGQWKDAEDWTNEAFKLFCLDKKDERLEELLIIVSNSGEMSRSSETAYRIYKDTPMRVSTSNVGCWRWEGTASQTTIRVEGPTTVEDVAGAVFNVFRLPGQGRNDLVGFDMFKSSNAGRASYSINGPLNGTGCTISGMANAQLQGDGALIADGSLIVNYLLAPGLVLNRMVIGDGRTNFPAVTVTITCPDKPPETSTSYKDVYWLSSPTDGVPVSEDGQSIVGRWDRTDAEGVKSSVWNFKAVREQ